MAKKPAGQSTESDDAASEATLCGIIMPIAAMPTYEAEHWTAMLELVSRSVRMAGMEPVPVWQGGAADVLQERIVRNLYELPFAVCDISGLNPNVMLELGLRLAFGKPTIIINDQLVRAPFDIGAIEYVGYDRNLHILKAEDFLTRLQDKIEWVQTAEAAGTYRPYIKTFGPIVPGTPGDEAVPLGQAILSQMEHLASSVRNLENRSNITPYLMQNGWSDTVAKLAAAGIGSAANEDASALAPYDPFQVPDSTNTALQGRLRAVQGVVEIMVITPQQIGVKFGGSPATQHKARFAVEKLLREYFS